MIRKFLIRVFVKLANLLSTDEKFVSNKFLRVLPWFRDKGDETHSLNHQLNENSVVFDLGGYLGEWSMEIRRRYNCNIHIFEPVQKYFLKIKEDLADEKILVNQFGLAEKTFTAQINISDEASSIFKEGEKKERIELIDFMDYVSKQRIDKIDLIKINIEGSEYDLLEYLLKTNYIKNISNIQVQFHDFFPDAEKRMIKIQNELSKTHKLTFQYPFIWENWQIIKLS